MLPAAAWCSGTFSLWARATPRRLRHGAMPSRLSTTTRDISGHWRCSRKIDAPPSSRRQQSSGFACRTCGYVGRANGAPVGWLGSCGGNCSGSCRQFRSHPVRKLSAWWSPASEIEMVSLLSWQLRNYAILTPPQLAAVKQAVPPAFSWPCLSAVRAAAFPSVDTILVLPPLGISRSSGRRGIAGGSYWSSKITLPARPGKRYGSSGHRAFPGVATASLTERPRAQKSQQPV